MFDIFFMQTNVYYAGINKYEKFLIFHRKSLTSLSQPPKQSDRFIIYIDESILFQQYEEKMLAERFITAFYMINAQNEDKLNQLYYQAIYQNGANHEKKSSQVSDRTNRKALTAAKECLSQAMILERQAVDYSQFGEWKKNMFLCIELLSYIKPVQDLLAQLKKETLKPDVIIEVVVDQTSQNCTDPCLFYNQRLLNSMADAINDEQTQFTIYYRTADSKECYGIQVADMLAGAYRKELVYSANDAPMELIPFPYRKKVLNENLSTDSDFINILGKIVYEQITKSQSPSLKIKVNENRPKANLKFESSLTWLKNWCLNLKLKKDNFAEADQILLKLSTITDENKRLDIIILCKSLNDQLIKIANNMGLKADTYVMTLSKKVSSTAYQKTIKNIRRNIRLLRQTTNNAIIRKRIAGKLKRFNKCASRHY